jgi:nicotinate-nucleotide pyrophosphorylase (carboxylating)
MTPSAPAVLPDLNAMSLPELFAHLRGTGLIRLLLLAARWEDLGPDWKPDADDGSGDITSVVCVPADRQGVADLVCRAAGVVAGLAVAADVIAMFGPACVFEARVSDGSRAEAGEMLGTLRGPARQVLAVERTFLNIVGRLSGIATRTAKFREALAPGVRAKVYDTRKTTPGMRVLEKYAVRCGGGCSHRLGLHDAVLMKDNHVAGVGQGEFAAFVRDAAMKARERRPDLRFVQVEVTTLEQLRAVLGLAASAGAGLIDLVLLDNMPAAMMREACGLRDALAPRLELEASGGINLETIREVSTTGVDRISVGSLTHGAASLDVALEMRTP